MPTAYAVGEKAHPTINHSSVSSLNPLSLKPEVNHYQKLSWLAWSASTLLLLILAFRLVSALTATTLAPGTAVTSGCEEESWFNIWRVVQGQAMYPDPSSPPYNAAYFNWGFYGLYAAVAAPVMAHWGESSLIPAGRLLTLAFAIGGSVLVAYFLRLRVCPQAPSALVWAFALFLFFGPIAAWWSITVRPDVPALAFEALAIFILLQWGSKRNWIAAIGSAIALYLAWSMKPSFVGGVPVAALYLWLRQGWKPSGFFCLLTISLWTLTLVLGGTAYRAALTDAGLNNVFNASLFFTNSSHALSRLLPLLIPLPWLVPLLRDALRARAWKTLPDSLLLGTIGTAITLPLYALASGKDGAALNYFMPVTLYLVLCAACVWHQAVPRRAAVFATALTLIILMQIGLMAGWWGKISLRTDARILAEKWEVFQDLPEPRFSADYRLNLPWLNLQSPSYILSFNYESDRSRGRQFEGGGLGGQIEQGHLAALLLPPGAKDYYDGADLRIRYNRAQEFPHGVVFLHKDISPR